ncbi:hypothetical protein [Amycolatopsis suaedae]|uniref:Uncharacterized protein n=1 Tax=Amycolatopsis suaedae TaxID=2510978 RepID=A0A4Q7JB55_9PSEU|nr:hypothetical protein [Amycolatopsis suaedae]RZQ64202.1 hypothetical protein EWH70_09445 [Amycolatopsis suaedae]
MRKPWRGVGDALATIGAWLFGLVIALLVVLAVWAAFNGEKSGDGDYEPYDPPDFPVFTPPPFTPYIPQGPIR